MKDKEEEEEVDEEDDEGKGGERWREREREYINQYTNKKPQQRVFLKGILVVYSHSLYKSKNRVRNVTGRSGGEIQSVGSLSDKTLRRRSGELAWEEILATVTGESRSAWCDPLYSFVFHRSLL